MATEWKQVFKPNSIYDPNGLRERRLSTGFCHLRIGFSSNPKKGDDWAMAEAIKYGGFGSAKWRRENLIDYKAFSGQRIWPLLSREHDIHIDISAWTIYRVIDQGIRHPTVCLWLAVNAAGDRHVFREYYAQDRSIAMNCQAIISLSSEPIEATFIDPSTAKRNDETLKSTIQVYEENGLYCIPADNSFAGYDAVSNGILARIARRALMTGIMPAEFNGLNPSKEQLEKIAVQPALTFDLRFAYRCFEECVNHRWVQTKGDLSQRAERERPVDKDDDGPDCVRYAMQSALYWKEKPSLKIGFTSIKQIITNKRKLDEMKDLYARRDKRYAN